MEKRQAVTDIAAIVLLVPASAALAVLLALRLAPDSANLAIVVFVQALVALAGTRILLARRSLSWSDIGLRPLHREDLLRAGGVMLAGLAAGAALGAVVHWVAPQVLEGHVAGLESIALAFSGIPRPVAVALLLLIGFYEEVVARGFLLSRARLLFGGFWKPVLFSGALFGLGHFYQGAYGIVQTALLGVVLAAFTIRWGTLWPAILAHAAINTLSLVQLAGIADG